MVENIIKSDNVTVAICKLFADGTYDGNDIFRCLADNGILPCIKVRKNARVDKKREHSKKYIGHIPEKGFAKVEG